MTVASTALIAGAGALPRHLAEALRKAGEAPLIAALEGFAPEGIAPDVTFRVERLMPFLRELEKAGVSRVTFAGAVSRPRLDPALFDPLTAQIVPRLIGAIQAGDDATLRAVIALFEEEGFAVAGVAEIAPDLVPEAGTLCGAPREGDVRDVARAAAIVEAIGRVDVGQGAVVAQGLCLAVEALPGTDAMLDWVAATARRPDPAAARGVLYKAPKPGQDRRIDLPTLGPSTVRRAAAAGLAGIAWEAGGVILLDRAEALREAEAAGLFLWAREP
ncbi:LpxI family protein [Rhodobacter sp. NSM]|uniref:LpxI family protein n=1 Tax=Rhodobacter sp. NSM TaxID=3457501 RepID=UPI003FD02A46